LYHSWRKRTEFSGPFALVPVAGIRRDYM